MCSARPPVAIVRVPSPSSPRRRPTIASTWPAKPKMTPERIASTRRVPDQRPRLAEVDARQRRGALGQRLHRDLHARRDDPAEVLRIGGDGVVGDGRPEVDDDARPADPVMGCDRVDEAVGAQLARVVQADRPCRSSRPGPRPACGARGSARPSRSTGGRAAAPSRRRSRRRCPRRTCPAAPAAPAAPRPARRPSTPAPSRSASARRGPPPRRCPGGSACSRRRRPAAWLADYAAPRCPRSSTSSPGRIRARRLRARSR